MLVPGGGLPSIFKAPSIDIKITNQPRTQQTVQAPYPVSATSYPAPMPTYAAPVAAPRVIKEVAEKDRRSRMAYSTYHQAPKKGGAGGAYTWGSAGDVMLDWSISTRIDHEIMII